MDRANTYFEQVPLEPIRARIAKGEITVGITDGEGPQSQPEPEFTEELKYPQWQKPFQEALLELDKDKLPKRVSVAETAILDRLHSMSQEPNNHAERQALADALSGLRILKKEIV
jgi:hypothetical protein